MTGPLTYQTNERRCVLQLSTFGVTLFHWISICYCSVTDVWWRPDDFLVLKSFEGMPSTTINYYTEERQEHNKRKITTAEKSLQMLWTYPRLHQFWQSIYNMFS